MTYEKLPQFNEPDKDPPHNGTDTSREAAQKIKKHRRKLSDDILVLLRQFPMGLTSAQIVDISGIKHQTATPRLKELRQECEPALV